MLRHNFGHHELVREVEPKLRADQQPSLQHIYTQPGVSFNYLQLVDSSWLQANNIIRGDTIAEHKHVRRLTFLRRTGIALLISETIHGSPYIILEPRSHGLSAPITSLQQGLDITITYIGPSFSLNIPIFGDGHQPDNMHGFTVKTAGIEIAIIANDPATGVPITVSIIFIHTDVMAAANAARARRTEEQQMMIARGGCEQ